MGHKRKQGFNFKKYNQSFQYEGGTWEVIHKTNETIYAIELNKKGKAGGPVLRFPNNSLATS
jgi:hypothetical protein